MSPNPVVLDDLARQPSGDEAYHKYDQETFTGHGHCCHPLSFACAGAAAFGAVLPVAR
jgi:hypothetical protein